MDTHAHPRVRYYRRRIRIVKKISSPRVEDRPQPQPFKLLNSVIQPPHKERTSASPVTRLCTPRDRSLDTCLTTKRRSRFAFNISAADSPLEQPQISYMTGLEALVKHADKLSSYEQKEIWEYNRVYFLGLDAQKLSEGFDDERGQYRVCINDHIAYRYEVIKILGKGTYGTVVEGCDYKRKQKVAIKILKLAKDHLETAAKEISILNKVKSDYSVQFKTAFLFRGHVCISFELLSISLSSYMKMQKFAGLNMPLIRRIAIQLLLGLKDIHSSGVIHCDIKPQNILLKHIHKTGVKIIDFGISCIGKPKIYNYLQTRYYRSPEVILGCSFGTAVDIWSLGCVLAELMNGSPIFKGEDEHDQMIKIMAVFGTLPQELLEKGYKRRYFFHMDNSPILKPNKAGEILQPACFSLRQVLKTTDEAFIDFLAACFEYLPEKRITATEALKHRWIIGKEEKSK